MLVENGKYLKKNHFCKKSPKSTKLAESAPNFNVSSTIEYRLGQYLNFLENNNFSRNYVKITKNGSTNHF